MRFYHQKKKNAEMKIVKNTLLRGNKIGGRQ